MMRAGQLRHKLSIERPQTETTASGHTKISSYDCIGTMRASIEPLRGREMLQAQQVNAETTHRIRARHRKDIRTSDRLTKDGRVFEIESILNVDERNRELEIMAIERTPDR